MQSENGNAARIRHDRTLDVTLDLWGCHDQEEKRRAKIQLRLFLPERGDYKGRSPKNTHRREPFSPYWTWVLPSIRFCYEKEDKEKTAFAIELGLYQWKGMPFRLMQFDGDHSKTDGSGFDQHSKEVWESRDVLCG